MRVEEEVELEMLAVVWWMPREMLGIAAHTGVVGAQRRCADMKGICICVRLCFVATLLHLELDLLLHAHDVVRSTFLLVPAGGTDDSQRSRTLTSSAIMLFERLPGGVKSVRAGEQRFRKLCLRRAALQRQQPVKGDEVEAFKNAGRHARAITATRLPRGNSRVAVRLVTTPKRVEDGLVDFERPE